MGDRDPIPHLDLYAELEVDPGASLEAIEAAYRALMKRSHPDLAGPAGLARSKRLNLARAWLTDPGRRASYDASRRTRASQPGSRAAPVTRPSRPEPPTSSAHRRRPPPTRSRRRRPSRAVAQAVLVIAVIAALVLAGVIVGLRDAGGQSTRPAPATPGPTPAPTPSSTIPATPRVTSAPSPTATPAATVTAVPLPRGSVVINADLRFSGDYVEHYAATPGAAGSCSLVEAPAGPTSTPHGFHLASGPESPAAWTLELDDLTGSWTMGVGFDDPALDLYWLAGVDAGYVSPSSTGYAFDVRMTGATASIRIEGTVVCGDGAG